jgi:Flp pilus assembly protein TadG
MTSVRTLFDQIARSTEGSALVEMTIVLPVFLSLMIGSVDFGMYFTEAATLDKSVRDAGRYLSSLPSSLFAGGSCPNWAQLNATDLVVYGKFPLVTTGSQPDRPLLNAWNVALPNGSPSNNVTITCSSTTITVSADAPHYTLMLSALLPVAGTLTLSARHEEAVVNVN